MNWASQHALVAGSGRKISAETGMEVRRRNETRQPGRYGYGYRESKPQAVYGKENQQMPGDWSGFVGRARGYALL